METLHRPPPPQANSTSVVTQFQALTEFVQIEHEHGPARCTPPPPHTTWGYSLEESPDKLSDNDEEPDVEPDTEPDDNPDDESDNCQAPSTCCACPFVNPADTRSPTVASRCPEALH